MPDLNKPFKSIAWPQDKLRVPSGDGLMPPLDLQNQRLVKREAWFIAGTIGDIAHGADKTVSFDVGDDGDFWLTGIGVQGYLPATTAFNNDIWSKLSITDLRSGYGVLYPSVRAAMFGVEQAGEEVAIIQPYCFTRTGGVQVTWSIDAVTANARASHRLYIVLYGWKEYQNAAK